ncbi:MAG: SDR family oxidoreductase [Cytophagaceae bacterium]
MQTVLILGATSDIGEAIAYEFARNKFNVILASRKHERLAPLKSDLSIRHNVEVSSVEFDALDFNSHKEFYKSLAGKIDVAVCVFGYLGDQKIAEDDNEETLKIINSNYSGAVSILNIIANDMESRKKGTIIGISSVAGERGRQSNYIYGSAKAAFTVYLDGLRNRLFKSGVHVITVKPGFVATKMIENLPPTPKPLTAKPSKVASDIFQAYKKKENTLYTLWMWKYIMLIIKNIPEIIFKKMKL